MREFFWTVKLHLAYGGAFVDSMHLSKLTELQTIKNKCYCI